jgi:hypothetical protein
MANISHGGVAKAILSSSQQNVGKHIFPDLVNPVSSPVTVAATIVGSKKKVRCWLRRKLLGHPLKVFLLKLLEMVQGILVMRWAL